MIWVYVGVTILFLIGVSIIIWGIRLTKDKHKKEKYFDDTAAYNSGVVETLVLFLISLLLKYLPYWLMRGVLILFGLAIILLGVLIVMSI
ncbi:MULTISPECIES: hypothetical protein [Sutcliffiella]|uniref:Uncharacterized protein n=1 Tax=Sutcliffiella horikoshii TaxID=79883 RepID=A0AA94WMC5_9BACI|nr:hypothetical protein [Sutcliffiella horikoshii]TYS58109.1 hypothetical protein FZC74_14045 [Sutcliffiella horikoshii]UAL46439.1 hypothetical protein K7887_16185 [Sutcliffiella horikoshii]